MSLMLYVSASAVLFDRYVLMMGLYVVFTVAYIASRPLVELRREVEAAALLCFLIGFVALVPLINADPNLTPYFTIGATLVLAFLLSRVLSLSRFAFVYVRVMLLLAFTSLVFFAVGLLAPAAVEALPHIEGQYLNYRDAGLHVYLVSSAPGAQGDIVARNSGFTWEPGAFSVLLNLALVLHLDRVARRPERRRTPRTHLPTAAFASTILTTLSPAGVLCMVITFVVYRRVLMQKDFKIGGGSIVLWLTAAYAGFQLSDILLRVVEQRTQTYFGTNDGAVLERLSLSRLDSLDLTPWFLFGSSFTTFEQTGLPIWNSILHGAIVMGYPFTLLLLALNFNMFAKFRPHAIAIGSTILVGYSLENYFWKPLFCFMVFAALVQSHHSRNPPPPSREESPGEKAIHA